MSNLLPTVRDGDEAEISLRDAWNLLRRNRLLIFGCFLLALAAAAAYSWSATPVYQASTSIRIDEKQSNLPVLDVLKTLASGSKVNTEVEVLRSRTLAEDVVDSLTLQVVLLEPRRIARREILAEAKGSRHARPAKYRLTRQPDGRFSVVNDETEALAGVFAPGERIALGGAVLVLAPAARRQHRIELEVREFGKATEALGEALKVARPSREADIVTVRYESTDPELVHDVPNAIASRFMARRRDVQKTEARSTVSFLHEQLDTLSVQLAASEDALREFREGERVVSLQAEAEAHVLRLAELQGNRSELDAERNALAALLEDVRIAASRQRPEEPSPYRRLIAFPSLLRNPAASEMLRSLAAVEDQRAALLTRRMEEDPDVQMLSTRIAELEGQLQSIGETYLQGLTNQVTALDATLAQFGQQLERVPAKEIQFVRLQRRPKVLEEIFTLLQTRLKEAEIAQAVDDASVRVVDAAIMPIEPIKPRKALNLALAGIIGVMLGIAVAFVREHMDRSVHTREALQSLTGLPMLGLIPRIQGATTARGRAVSGPQQPRGRLSGIRRLLLSSGSGGTGPTSAPVRANGQLLEARLVTGSDPRNPVSEAYRALRTNIAFARPDKPAKTLVFTSPMPGDGKSTTSANLAITLVQQGLKVLLIDADMRRGALNVVFRTARGPGLSNVLLGAVSLDQALQRIDLGPSGTLDFLSTGMLPPNPAELLGSTQMRGLLQSLEQEYDAVILDAPPLTVVTDAAVLGTSADGVILIARAGVTMSEALAYAMEQLRNVRAPVLGAVLNDVDFKKGAGYYGSYGYYQSYYAAEEEAA